MSKTVLSKLRNSHADTYEGISFKSSISYVPHLTVNEKLKGENFVQSDETNLGAMKTVEGLTAFDRSASKEDRGSLLPSVEP